MNDNFSPLLTDLYQLTMAYGYWRLNIHEKPATFHLLFRRSPFNGNYALSCGVASTIDFLTHWQFKADDLDYLATLKNSKQQPLFSIEFLDYLKSLHFNCHVYMVPDGTVVFPHAPLLRIEGPLLQCQLLESPLLNLINFQTLIATKASRVCRAAENDEVIEFGMRRAQGPNGALAASRAAYIGGCHATSNTLAGKLYDIPVRGTHAHSWITAFESEKDAFSAYTEVLPDNSVLLVDTYNTVYGVKNAIEAGKKLRQQGSELLGIRLDSGDLASLSIKARQLLDDAGFKETMILASNSLDEYVIADLKKRGAKISAWGVGTHLVTAYDQPALDGVYKLSALKNNLDQWDYKLKLSEQAVKISNPGRHQVRRFFCNDVYSVDMIYDLDIGIEENAHGMVLDHSMKAINLDDYDGFVDLLTPVFENGKLIAPLESIHETRREAILAVKNFYAKHGDQSYPVALEKKLFELKQKLIHELRTKN